MKSISVDLHLINFGERIEVIFGDRKLDFGSISEKIKREIKEIKALPYSHDYRLSASFVRDDLERAAKLITKFLKDTGGDLNE